MESFIEVVNLVKENIREQISDVAFNCWIAPIEPVKFEGDKAIIYIKTKFQKDILIKQYIQKISHAFEEILGFEVNIVIATEDDIGAYINNVPEKNDVSAVKKQEETPKNDILSEGSYEYTFDTFIMGPSNNFAYAACKGVATQQPGVYNPLFIYAPSGLGKTHLLMAIANEIKRRNPNANVLMINSETFTNELIISLQTQRMEQFRSKYRSADILLVDDIHFIAGKNSTQEEFFHTFNELYRVGKQIVLTSDRPPKEIKTLEERLRYRFEQGLIADISPPDFETRIAIINRKAALLQIEIPADVVEFIANNLKTNIRQLEGAVKKIKAYKLMVGSPPSLSVAQTVIMEILNDNQPVEITVERIIDEVAKTYSVDADDIKSSKRCSAQISMVRQIATYIVREVTTLSTTEIGQSLGGRDHSTISYALKTIKRKMNKDEKLKAVIDDIIKNIQNN